MEKFHPVTLTLIGKCPMSNSSKLFLYTELRYGTHSVYTHTHHSQTDVSSHTHTGGRECERTPEDVSTLDATDNCKYNKNVGAISVFYARSLDMHVIVLVGLCYSHRLISSSEIKSCYNPLRLGTVMSSSLQV